MDRRILSITKVGYGDNEDHGADRERRLLVLPYVVCFLFLRAALTEVGGRVMSLAGSTAHFDGAGASYLTGKKHKKESKKQEEKK